MIPPIVVVFFPALGFSCLDAIAAYMVNVVGMTIFQVMTLATSILLPYLFHKETPHAPIGPPGCRMLLWTRGVMMTFNLFLVYTSLRYLTISEFWMVTSCTPFPTAILCWYFLSEKFTKMQGICCVLSIIGVLLITNPLGPGDTRAGPGNVEDHIPTGPIYKLLGLAFSVPSTVVIGVDVMIMRKMGNQAEHVQILAALALAPAVITACILAIGQFALAWPSTAFEWMLLVGTVPFGWLAQFTAVYAAQRLSGMTVVMTTYTGLVHSTIIQWLVYGNPPNFITAAGIVLIVTTGIIAAIYEQADPEPKAEIVEGDSGDEDNMDDLEDTEAGPSIPLLSREGREELRK